MGRGLARGLRRHRATGGAEPGDRTMLDALIPAAAAFAEAVDAGSRRTTPWRRRRRRPGRCRGHRGDDPGKGRSSYLGDRALGHPDPGAEGLRRLAPRKCRPLTQDRPFRMPIESLPESINASSGPLVLGGGVTVLRNPQFKARIALMNRR